MKKIFTFLFVQCIFFCSAFAQEGMIREAENAYNSEDYGKAIQLYEEILSIYGESAEIYYNLGNAYYRTGEIAPTILNYERALLLDPGDADVRFNLKMAKLRAVDNIEPLGEFFLSKWIRGVQNMGSANSWGIVAVVCFIFFIGCLLLFFFSRWLRLKKIGFYVGCFLLILIIFANIFASNQKEEIINRKSAIVFSSTVTVKSSPDVSGTDLFLLHEGTKVFIKSTIGTWKEIELEDGNRGWMPEKDLQVI